MNQTRKQSILYAHTAALLFGGTALFAKMITLPAEVITFWRAAISILVMLSLCALRRQTLRLERKRDAWMQIGLGLILGIHWATYYGAIQLSSVAIGVTALYVSPILSVLIESAIRRVWPDAIDLLLGGIVFIGVLCLVPDLNWENDYTKGILLGVVSAFFLTVRQILHTKTRAKHSSGLVLLFYQLIGISLLLAFFGLKTDPSALSNNWVPLVLLGVFFTAAPHFCNISALRNLEAKTTLIITSLMVPYGIVLGALILDEIPDLKTLIGCALIMIAATTENLRAGREQKVSPQQSVQH